MMSACGCFHFQRELQMVLNSLATNTMLASLALLSSLFLAWDDDISDKKPRSTTKVYFNPWLTTG